MLPGAPAQVVRGAQGRGPLESISPCCAVHSLYDCLLGESKVHVGQGQPLCKWVSSSALSRVSEPRPPKRPPTRRLLLPRTGLAHGAGLKRGAFDFTSDFRFGQERYCCESRRSPPRLRRSVLALHPQQSRKRAKREPSRGHALCPKVAQAATQLIRASESRISATTTQV